MYLLTDPTNPRFPGILFKKPGNAALIIHALSLSHLIDLDDARVSKWRQHSMIGQCTARTFLQRSDVPETLPEIRFERGPVNLVEPSEMSPETAELCNAAAALQIAEHKLRLAQQRLDRARVAASLAAGEPVEPIMRPVINRTTFHHAPHHS